jgi:hypothetical protein
MIAVALAMTAAGAAHADGDPASDVLYTDQVFFPYNTTVSKSAQDALVGTVHSANSAGYPIRVALIAQQSDLGAISSLWKKPRQYAKFLSLELGFIYKGSLLIVMPSGLGFAHFKRETEADYQTLSTIRVAAGQDGLSQTAVQAVTMLAAKAGHTITPGSTSSKSSGASALLATAIAITLLVVAAGGVMLLRRRGGGDRGEGRDDDPSATS